MTERIASLDLLRGIAAGAVAVSHFCAYAGQSRIMAESIAAVAVEIFFVLSGFVLAPQLLLLVSGEGGLGTFLIRRWMRTIPPYLIALVLVSVLMGNFLSIDFWRYATYTQNIFSQELTNDYYPVAWSLSIEEWFYLVFPFILMLAGRRYAGVVVLFILAVSLFRSFFGDPAAWGVSVRRVVAFRIELDRLGLSSQFGGSTFADIDMRARAFRTSRTSERGCAIHRITKH